MALADDLLDVAQDLADLDAVNPRDATRRRSISTTYYALFHLLISEAVANWQHPDQRYILARQFEHGPMHAAAEAKISELKLRLKTNPPVGQERIVADSLLLVASAFATAQEARFEADYNLGKEAPLDGHAESA